MFCIQWPREFNELQLKETQANRQCDLQIGNVTHELATQPKEKKH